MPACRSQQLERDLEAKRLIALATYGPETLSVLFQAFDEAWRDLAPSCGENPLAIHAGRLKLANAILSLARNEVRDVGTMKDAALKMLAGT